MNATLESVCKSLDELSTKVLSSWTENRTLQEVYGWNHPALTRQDLASLPKNLASRLREANILTLDEQLDSDFLSVPKKLTSLYTATIPYMFNGNGINAIPAYISTLDWLQSNLEPLMSWQILSDNKAMPTKMAARLRAIQVGIDEIVPEKEKLEEQIKLIQEATSAAESLPTDLYSLKQAQKQVEEISNQSSALFGKIDLHATNANESSERIKVKELEAEKLVEQCNEAYRITTSTGLAGAFDDRAKRLSTSMWWWVLGISSFTWIRWMGRVNSL